MPNSLPCSRLKVSRLRVALLAGFAFLGLSGCAQVPFESTLAKTNQAAPGFTQGQLRLLTTAEERNDAQTLTNELLKNRWRSMRRCIWRWCIARPCRLYWRKAGRLPRVQIKQGA